MRLALLALATLLCCPALPAEAGSGLCPVQQAVDLAERHASVTELQDPLPGSDSCIDYASACPLAEATPDPLPPLPGSNLCVEHAEPYELLPVKTFTGAGACTFPAVQGNACHLACVAGESVVVRVDAAWGYEHGTSRYALMVNGCGVASACSVGDPAAELLYERDRYEASGFQCRYAITPGGTDVVSVMVTSAPEGDPPGVASVRVA